MEKMEAKDLQVPPLFQRFQIEIQASKVLKESLEKMMRNRQSMLNKRIILNRTMIR
jgi:hypothetical protein